MVGYGKLKVENENEQKLIDELRQEVKELYKEKR